MSIVIRRTPTAVNFSGRATNGKKFEVIVMDTLRSWGFMVALNGTEHTHSDFVKALHRSNDPTSLMIRYAPDAVIASGETPLSAHVEAKNSTTIEKNAYLNYYRLFLNGAVVYVVVNDKAAEKQRFCRVENMDTYIPGDNDFPIDEDGWIAPRLNMELFRRKKREGFTGSGTPYRRMTTRSMIDWNKNNFWVDFIAEVPK